MEDFQLGLKRIGRFGKGSAPSVQIGQVNVFYLVVLVRNVLLVTVVILDGIVF